MLHGLNLGVSFWQSPFEWIRDAFYNVVHWENPIDDLKVAAREVVTFFEELLSSFTVGDWVLLALAAAAVYWLIESLKALARLGPIEVDALEHDGAGGVTVKALTAQLRERLFRSGLNPPPAVPAGTPQVNLIAAVEASSIPQAAWIAKLLEMLPKPPKPREYKVSGTLLGPELSDPPYLLRCSLSFWVRPSRAGGSRLATVPKCRDHSEAVDAAASKIYLHISNDAVRAFPLWARWNHEDSLEAYLKGCRLQEPGPNGSPPDFAKAIEKLQEADDDEVFNALAALRVANLYEQLVPLKPLARRAEVQAQALRRYMEIASDWRELVEARYRMSVTAAALASTVNRLIQLGDSATLELILEYLELPNVESIGALENGLRDLADRQSKYALQLLQPWHALLSEFRLRSQFEPKAAERRALRHTVAIARHCHYIRRVQGSKSPTTWIGIRRRSLAVHVRHLVFGRGTFDWRARYNAACFDALLLEHLRGIHERAR